MSTHWILAALATVFLLGTKLSSARAARFFRIGAAAWFGLAVLSVFTLERANPIWDSQVYHWMASGHLLAGDYEPFCRRILVPAVAAALPLPLESAFELLNFACLWLAAVWLWLFLEESGLSPSAAAAGLALFLGSAFTKFVVWYRFGVDQAAVLGIALVVRETARRRFVRAAACASVAVVAKESVLFLAPFTFGALESQRPGWPGLGSRLVRTALLWALPLALFLALGKWIPAHQGTGFLETVAYWTRLRIGSLKAPTEIVLALPKTFGALALVLALSWRSSLRAFRADPAGSAVIAVFLLLGMLAASDYERVYFLAFPFVIRAFLRVLAERPLTTLQAATLAVVHCALLGTFARADFPNLGQWFMVNATWTTTGEFALEVALAVVALLAVGIGREPASGLRKAGA